MVAATLARPDGHNGPVDLDELSHSFALNGGHIDVLDRVSLQIAAGEFVALLGPSGCGKSTLLRLIAGLESPSKGTIRFDGRPVLKPDPSRALVFQDPTLLPWRTVQNNVSLGLEARGVLAQQCHRVDQTLDLVGLKPFSKAYPHQLSGGMAQRAALARALVNDPRLFLMDEPLGKLDSLTRFAMQKEIVKLWRETAFTAVLVTHDVEEALIMAQRVVVFSERPARIQADIANDAPYPRHRDDAAIATLRQEVLALLGVER